MKKNLSTLVGALMALALIATACGGSDSPSVNSADQEVIDAVAEQLRDEELPEDVDANCMAGALVSGLGGAEAMEANYGLDLAAIQAGEDPNDVELSKEDAIALADGVMGCGIGDLMVSEMTGDGMSESDATCLFEKIDQDVLRDMFATEFMSEADAAAVEAAASDSLFSTMIDAFSECDLDPSAFGA